MKRFFWEFLHPAPVERRGFAVFFAICVLSLIVPRLYEDWMPTQPSDFSQIEAEYRAAFGNRMQQRVVQRDSLAILTPFDPNEADFEELVALGLSERTARSICNYRDKGGRFRRPEDFKKIYTLSEADYQRLLPYIRIGGGAESGNYSSTQRHWDKKEKDEATPGERFDFDPNTISEADLRRLKINPRATRGWLNYRDKGGKFKKSDDLRKLYNLTDEEYLSLEPYIVLGSTTASTAPLAPAPATYATGRPAYTPRTAQSIDINQSAQDDWIQLPGIGDGWARRILNFRDKLGGFTSVVQVAETRGLPDSVFQKAKNYLIFGQPAFRQLNVNTATSQELSMHPYFSAAQARAVVAYRDQHGPFARVDDLLKMTSTKPDWFAKVKPYLTTQ
jgi:DNA uptake protein ComE-like DNA-binding protein